LQPVNDLLNLMVTQGHQNGTISVVYVKTTLLCITCKTFHSGRDCSGLFWSFFAFLQQLDVQVM